MTNRRRMLSLIGNVCTYILVAFVAACGGGSGNSSSNTPPPAVQAPAVTADPGDIVAVRVGQVAMLDGSRSSTTTTNTLTYAWSFSSKPDGSRAVLLNETTATPSFVADVVGTYRVQLIVTAGNLTSPRAIGFVEVTNPGDYLTGLRDHTSYTAVCSECHDGRFAQGDGPVDPVPPKAGAHPATSNMCAGCHTTFGFNILRTVDHLEVFGNCSYCHNGVIATGKSVFHIVTNAECDSCHTTTSFITLNPDGTYDHTGITSGCVRCHDGRVAIGKDADPTPPHPTTTSDCSSCHNTISFANAYPDHNGPDVVGKRCDTCHNSTGGGFGASDQPVGHPVMTRTDMTVEDCGTCHSTTGFNMGGVFSHRILSSTVLRCDTCHNDSNSIGAPGKASDPTPPHPATTADCGTCHGLGGGSFALAVYDHTGITNNCGQSGCHDPSSVTGSYAAGPTHVPSNGNDCENCHTAGGTFMTGVFDHTAVEADMGTRCDSCHNDSISIGKSFNHIPTTQDCRACHNTTTFVGAVFTHTGITSGCQTCHDGNIATGKHAAHMPTTPADRDCVDCHAASLATFTDFTGGMFDHTVGVSNNCATCHNGVIALGKHATHIPSQTECSQCHTDTTVTGGFMNSIFITNVHPNITTGCEGCHKTQFFPNPPPPALVKAAGHIPTTQDCRFCHTNTAFTPQIFNHSGITGNCQSCHNGNYVTPAGALGKTPTPPHPATTSDCGACHNTTNFADVSTFDHTGRVDNCNECHLNGTATKKPPTHVPTVPANQDCSVCHVPGTFANAVFNHTGIVNNCSSCHDGSVAAVTVKSMNHLPTTQDCSVCHNTTSFAGARYDHTGIVNGCATCHDGVIALGKHGTHVPTNEDCSVCHQTTGFRPATFSHAGIVDNCASCHNGVFAQGKKTGHVLTTQDCGVCHTPNGFIPATFDHTGIVDNCSSCHGVTATGKSANHLATSLDCHFCHTTATFVGGTWVHDASTVGVCNTCHSVGGGATPQPATGHFQTTVQCDSCHNTTGWAPANTFDHCAGQTKTTVGTCTTSNYPGNHRRALTCIQCHGNNSQVVTWPYPTDTATPPRSLVPECAACHRNRFKAVDKHIGGKSGTVYQNRDCSGGGTGCHRVNQSEF